MDNNSAKSWITSNAATVGGVILVVLLIIQLILFVVIIYNCLFKKKVNISKREPMEFSKNFYSFKHVPVSLRCLYVLL